MTKQILLQPCFLDVLATHSNMRQKKLQIFLMNLLLDVYICLVSQEEECTSSF